MSKYVKKKVDKEALLEDIFEKYWQRMHCQMDDDMLHSDYTHDYLWDAITDTFNKVEKLSDWES